MWRYPLVSTDSMLGEKGINCQQLSEFSLERQKATTTRVQPDPARTARAW
jgi:hypothetical protein